MPNPWEAALQQLPIPAALKPFVVPPKIRRLYEQAASAAPEQFLPSLLQAMDVEPIVSDADLIMVDLRQTPTPVLDRYLGKEPAASFLAWHKLKP